MSMTFEGDAPKAGGTWTFFVPTSCKVYVMPGTKGWGTVPGRWNGFNTYYAVDPPPPERPEEPVERLQLNVKAKGVVKIADTWEDGKTVSASAQLVIGDGFACIPVMVKETKSVRGFSALLRIDGEKVALAGDGKLVAGGRTVSDLGEPMAELVTTAKAKRAYSARLKMPELVYPLKFSAKKLPSGLKINAATGVISGTPSPR